MKNRVLFVHDGPLQSNKTGTMFYGIHYNDRLIKRYSFFGDSVTFLMRSTVINNSDASRYTPITYNPFQFIEIPNFKSLKSYRNKSKARQIIKKAVQNHNIIIVRLPSAAGAIAFWEARKQEKPVIVEFVACVFDALWNYDWRGKLLAKYKYMQYQRLMKRASHTIYVTDNFLQERYPTEGKSIGCSDVVLQEIDSAVLQNRLNHINKQNGILKLATVAAIDVVYKGQADVIRAIAKLKTQGILFQYDIIGQGDPSRLQRLIDQLEVQQLVQIVGPLPHIQVFEHLKTIDIYIQPSKQEGLPRSVIEALSVACPVLGTNTGGIPELIENECVYNKNNIDSLITILKNIDKDFLIKHAEINFEKAKSYQNSSLIETRNAFYREFMNDYNLVE